MIRPPYAYPQAKVGPEVICAVSARFGPHGGAQFREPRYFKCGCDCGYCEAHGTPMFGGQRYGTESREEALVTAKVLGFIK